MPQDPFTQQVVQWLAIAQASYIITPLLLFSILIAVLVLISRINKMIDLQEQSIIARLPDRTREKQIV
jgi:hypothetical protein